MHDWLKEHYPDLPAVSVKTVFNDVSRVRRKYELTKTLAGRDLGSVPDIPYGSQAQVYFQRWNLFSHKHLINLVHLFQPAKIKVQTMVTSLTNPYNSRTAFS